MTTATAEPKQRIVVDWEGYLNLPSDLTHYEIIDGEVKPLATPTFKHQLVVGQLMLVIAPVVRGKRLGELLTAPYDVVVQRAPVRTRQPDLMFLSRARFAHLTELADAPRLEQPPDLVIEVLSPSDTDTAWADKVRDYHTLGVPEVWAVDIARRAIEVLVYEATGYRSLGWFEGAQVVRSQVLGEVALQPAQVFEVLNELEAEQPTE
ncbi:MAG: Uma2 family endonuclease [Fimbriimonadales bacterium]|nr:Uma2 family endonuclease [Fimbriimonadales bacterium]